MTSNTSNNTATASAPSNSTAAVSATHNHQQEAVLPSPTNMEQDINTKKKALAAQPAGGSGEPKRRRRPQKNAAALSCPRCFSTRTKFCYYNNYNLNQPRYNCKDCERYWTQGGSLRVVPVGGGCSRNKRAAAAGSSSSSAASSSSTTATRLMVNSNVTTRLMLTDSMLTPSVSTTTGLIIHNDMLPAFAPTAGGSAGGLDVAMDDERQSLLPFSPPLSLSGGQAPEKLAPGGSDIDMMPPTFAMDAQEQQGFMPFAPLSLSDGFALEELAPTFLDMMTGGNFDVGGSSSSSYSYGGDLSMGGGTNLMDMSFLLPEVMWGAATDDPMQTQTQLLEGMKDVADELQWASAELDSFFNDNGGYAEGPDAGVHQQQQQVAGDQQEYEGNNKAKESSKNNGDDGGSSAYGYWSNNNDGAEG